MKNIGQTERTGLSFDEAMRRTHEKYGEALRRLAEGDYLPFESDVLGKAERIRRGLQAPEEDKSS